MKPQHAKWIADTVPSWKDAYGACHEVAEKMVSAFPLELRIARGFYHSLEWGERQHWWCVDLETGDVVDPTAAQFPCGGIAELYDELVGTDEEIADRVPTGVCMDCGGPVYHGDTFCSKACERATIAYLNETTNPHTKYGLEHGPEE